ncbi:MULTISPECIES: hypothetical protein [unclassified Burkholderia]|uniref:hypothetical protein n=1 Tax=unclassified Burkholderia TaxID=2613784 RepID=UPI002AB0F4E1|nr:MULTISPECIES: hypothetical protein [unclassified Burkholderia]
MNRADLRQSALNPGLKSNPQVAGWDARSDAGSHADSLFELFVPEAYRVLAAYARSMNVSFRFGPLEFPAEDVFAPEGLLPLIALRAHERMIEHAVHPDGSRQFGLSQGLAMELEPSESAMLGQVARLAPLDGRADSWASVRMLYLIEAADTVLGLDDDAEVDIMPVLEFFSEATGAEGGQSGGSADDSPTGLLGSRLAKLMGGAGGGRAGLFKWPLTKTPTPR